MLAGVQVQHEVDQRPLHERPGAFEEGEAGPGDLGGALEIQDPQVLADVPMGLGFEGKAGRLAPGLDHGVVVGGGAHGDAGVRQVGQGKEEFPHPGIVLGRFRLPFLDPLIDLLDLVHQWLGLAVQAGLFLFPTSSDR